MSVKAIVVRSVTLGILLATAVGLTLLTSNCALKRKVKTKMDGEQEKAVISLEGGDVKITLSNAGQIKRSLERYLKDSQEEIKNSLPENLRQSLPAAVGDPALDSGGHWRLSPWLLEGRGDQLVLTYRVVTPTQSTFGYQYLAYLERKNDNWEVSGIGYEKLYPHR